MARAHEPHKTSQTPAREGRREDTEDPEWRGGDRPIDEARSRSGERGWGQANAGGQRQQGGGGQRAGDTENQDKGRRDEAGDLRRPQQSEESEAGQGNSNR